MTTHTFANCSRIELKPMQEDSALLFRLTFQKSQHRTDSVEFELPADHAMALMVALQGRQARFGWAIPKSLRARGKPSLRVVTD